MTSRGRLRNIAVANLAANRGKIIIGTTFDDVTIVRGPGNSGF